MNDAIYAIDNLMISFVKDSKELEANKGHGVVGLIEDYPNKRLISNCAHPAVAEAIKRLDFDMLTKTDKECCFIAITTKDDKFRWYGERVGETVCFVDYIKPLSDVVVVAELAGSNRKEFYGKLENLSFAHLCVDGLPMPSNGSPKLLSLTDEELHNLNIAHITKYPYSGEWSEKIYLVQNSPDLVKLLEYKGAFRDLGNINDFVKHVINAKNNNALENLLLNTIVNMGKR